MALNESSVNYCAWSSTTRLQKRHIESEKVLRSLQHWCRDLKNFSDTALFHVWFIYWMTGSEFECENCGQFIYCDWQLATVTLSIDVRLSQHVVSKLASVYTVCCDADSATGLCCCCFCISCSSTLCSCALSVGLLTKYFIWFWAGVFLSVILL